MILSSAMALQPNLGLDHLIVEVFRSHTPYVSERLVSPSQRPRCLRDTQVKGTKIHVFSGIRTCDPSSRVAPNLRLRPQGHRDRQDMVVTVAYLVDT
jgi:hypothetical protein